MAIVKRARGTMDSGLPGRLGPRLMAMGMPGHTWAGVSPEIPSGPDSS
ncbi:MAG: hypothetical protein AVDCRST_MAG70-2390 [uncultured Thermomicrobiales bacterium]|uniref:Uncharacterized protein n=1 Tax=uncultured Thermomicrobiales bacterium TaxID=1645740 RepID=A0A6J4V657_9BACT|nr:MAG: hypothetical protein AVDCRST_MAG70-2390 [uncultured Thermomicrobiales bacterium]